MGIQTKFPITLEIDESSFSIVVADPTKEQKEVLKKIVEKGQGLYTTRDAQKAKLDEDTEAFEINKHILAHGSVGEKISVMFEQKRLNKAIFANRAEMKLSDESVVSTDETIENIFENRFDLLVSGKDKDGLKKELEVKGIAYTVLFQSIASLIQESKEKK